MVKQWAAEAGGSETKKTEVREVRNYPGKGGRINILSPGEDGDADLRTIDISRRR